MTENEISKVVVNLCFQIHKQYGPGLFESVYEELFCYELSKAGLFFKRQHPVPLVHKEIKMEIGFRADVIVEDKVIVELKSVEALADVHYKQVHTYLKLSDCKLGLLIHRIVNNL
jgi:GxxExxY protein